MRKLVFSLNISLDGYCNHDDFSPDEEYLNYINELLDSYDTVLFGRVTYRLFEDYWPGVAKNKTGRKPEIEFAEFIDKSEKVVFSKTLKEVTWNNTTWMHEINSDIILKIKQKPGKDILIAGSPGLASTLMRLNLIDEYNFIIQPIITMRGKKFPEPGLLNNTVNLKLTGSRALKSGVVILNYKS